MLENCPPFSFYSSSSTHSCQTSSVLRIPAAPTPACSVRFEFLCRPCSASAGVAHATLRDRLENYFLEKSSLGSEHWARKACSNCCTERCCSFLGCDSRRNEVATGSGFLHKHLAPGLVQNAAVRLGQACRWPFDSGSVLGSAAVEAADMYLMCQSRRGLGYICLQPLQIRGTLQCESARTLPYLFPSR